MTRSEALRRIVTAPRDHVDQGRIGYRQLFSGVVLRRLSAMS
jgi:hypothetical protein